MLNVFVILFQLYIIFSGDIYTVENARQKKYTDKNDCVFFSNIVLYTRLKLGLSYNDIQATFRWSCILLNDTKNFSAMEPNIFNE